MTEAEWLACDDPVSLLNAVCDGSHARKVRLLALSCCQRIRYLLGGEDMKGCRAAVAVLEDGAEAPDDERDLRIVLGDAVGDAIDTGASICHPGEAGLYALHAAACAFECVGRGRWAHFADLVGDAAAYDALARSGNPDLERISVAWKPRKWLGEVAQRRDEAAVRGLPEFVSALRIEQNYQVGLIRDIFGNPFHPIAFSPDWRTGTVVTLARTMYESRDFSAMPILADAIQDAGCDSDDILNHCRGPGPHVKGCWVVDLVLGKE